MDWLGAVVRFVVSALVLMLVGLIVPGFGTLGFWQALLAALVIAAIGEHIWKEQFSLRPGNRGIFGVSCCYLDRSVLCSGNVCIGNWRVNSCLCHRRDRYVRTDSYSLEITA